MDTIFVTMLKRVRRIRPFLYFCLFLLENILISSSKAQNISGVINTYQHVISSDTCLNTVTVASTAGFSIGDRVLLIQMTGATIDTTNTASYGTVLSLGPAGLCEIGTIMGFPSPGTIRFRDKLINQYDPTKAKVQIVSVPQFTDVTVMDTLRPLPWQWGFGTGGVFAMEISGTLTANAAGMVIMDGSGAGYPGGAAASSRGGDSVIDYIFDGYYGPLAGAGGYKGEGVTQKFGLNPFNNDWDAAGRGAVANGGGGGNAHNAGGGGGGNTKSGGRGGDQTDATEFGQFANGGEGGKGLTSASFGRLFMGGGGGGGHQNDHRGTNGASGGAIIYLRVHKIVGNNLRIVSNGSTPPNLAVSDGAGGGGAGGTIIADVDSVLLTSGAEGSLSCDANGGVGGSVNAQNGPFAFGPGGGGSGGVVHARTIYGKCTITVNGGQAGTVTNCSNALTNNTSYGAAPGDMGNADNAVTAIVASNLQYDYPTALDHAISICKTDSAQLRASGGTSYQWSVNGVQIGSDSSVNVAPSVSTIYYALIQRNNCSFVDSVQVTVHAKPLTAFDGPVKICAGNSAIYSVAAEANTNYTWSAIGGAPSTGTGTTFTVNWTAPGPDTLFLTASNANCDATHTSEIIMLAPLVPVIQATAQLLSNPGDSSILSLLQPYTYYKWSTGDTSAQITVYTPGEYSVLVTDSNGCSGIDSIEILSPSGMPAIELALPSLQAAPGNHVRVMVSVARSQNLLKANVTHFSYVLCVNKTLLAPADGTIPFTISGEWLRISRSNSVSSLQLMGDLDDMDFIAALGDTLQAAIYLDSVTWVASEPVETMIDTGHFTLLGVCPAGGNRLFSENGRVLLSAVIPNPADKIATVSYSLAEPGVTSLSVLDILGRTMYVTSNAAMLPGDYNVTIDACKLSPGYYRVLLRTPSQVFTSLMEVRH